MGEEESLTVNGLESNEDERESRGCCKERNPSFSTESFQ